MKNVFLDEDGNRIVVDTEKDECLYSPDEPNMDIMEELFVYTTKGGDIYFYKHVWGKIEESLELMEKDEAENFLIEKLGMDGENRLFETEVERYKKYGLNLLD